MADEIIDKVEELEEPKTEEPTTEEPKEELKEEKKEEPKLSSEQEMAIGLFNALQNPETAGPTLRHLAELAGLDLVKKSGQKELKKDIKTLVKERLGEDNSILAESLGPLLDEVIKDAVEEHLKPLKAERIKEKETQFASQIEATFKELETESKGLSTKLEAKMLELMEQINPGPNTPPDKYIRHIFKLAKAEYTEAELLKAQNKKQADNKKTTSIPGGANPDRIKAGSRLPTIKEAVEAAMRGETLE